MKTIRLLTIAGSDSGGGAGIQADLKTFGALGGYGMSVITALTAQNTLGVHGVQVVTPEFVGKQMDAVLSDIGADAVKIGMLANATIIQVVAEHLRTHAVRRIVLDPVMVATSGDRLLESDAVAALREELLPLAMVATPNLAEAEVLTGSRIDSPASLQRAAELLCRQGPEAVLVKGGHFEGARSDDGLAYRVDGRLSFEWIEARRIETRNTHGTGCTLSAAIAAYLGRGWTIPESVRAAKSYITRAIEAAVDQELGRGHGPVAHYHQVGDII